CLLRVHSHFRHHVFERSGDHRDLHSFPTRRSSDLSGAMPMPALPLWKKPIFSAKTVSAMGSHRRQAALEVDARAEARPEASKDRDRKSTRLNSSHVKISYAVFCLKKKKIQHDDADY